MKLLIIITTLLLCFSISAKADATFIIDGVKVDIKKRVNAFT
ncbi:hypothetical protein [Aeromonas hydrophila]|nr:hypothetical protein [Aeromonas hydrophila]